ncbi:protease acp1 [Coniella lustricola]|uniref:Protease acp1 n=1 Tax=Coniella lustricola TaxID=2025994 RepID=A0A2T3A050_9PEZI|nr:protease acp1 [Coniella lustricola]
MAKSRAARRHSMPNRKIESPADQPTNDTMVSYSENWSGAVLVGTGYTAVTGKFTVPTPSTTGSGAAWVGIDGDTCSTSILQTGVSWTKGALTTSYEAWYEWYPHVSIDFTGITISAGDSIQATVSATSEKAGTATVENLTTGETATHTFTAETDELCEYNAEWIVEDFEEGDSLVTFANYGSVEFTDAEATQSGSTVDTSGATIIDMRTGLLGSVESSCTATGTTVSCTYG